MGQVDTMEVVDGDRRGKLAVVRAVNVLSPQLMQAQQPLLKPIPHRRQNGLCLRPQGGQRPSQLSERSVDRLRDR